jgi:hypothetical protein
VAPAVREHPEAGPQLKEVTVDVPSVAAGDPLAYAAQKQAQEELVEAARFAVRWFRQREQHAPPDTEFGGEAEVEVRLRQAIVRVTREV